MQTQPTDWVEIIKAIGPFATAIAAIVVSFLGASLAHRNWRMQFQTEKLSAFNQEQIRLLQEIPRKLVDLQLAAQTATIARVNSATYQRLAQVFEEGAKAKAEAIQQNFQQQYEDIMRKLTFTLSELFVLPIICRVYFGEDAAQAVNEFISGLKRFLDESEASIANIRDSLLSTFQNERDLDRLPSQISQAISNGMEPLIAPMREFVQRVVEIMADQSRQKSLGSAPRL